ncbi:MAG TPA: hypothetical protein VGM94_06640 [Galbitalea sp.]|jgi:hypothetical protein
MSTITPTPIASPTFQKFAVAIFSVLLVGFGGVGALALALHSDTPTAVKTAAVVAFGILVLGAVLKYAVPVLPTGWQGAAKVGVGIVVAVLVALVPFLTGGFDWATDLPLIAIAVVEALATQLGVTVRTNGETS